MLVLVALAAGLAVGYARDGRLRRLLDQPPERSRLLLTALGLVVVGVLAGWAWEPLLAFFSALSGLAIAFYAWINRRFQGALLVAGGFALNALVLLLNGAVPVSEQAADRIGADTTLAASDVVPTAGATLPWLGKVIPVAFPPSPEVVSAGDVAIAAGLGLVVAAGMTRRPAAAEVADDDDAWLTTPPPGLVIADPLAADSAGITTDTAAGAAAEPTPDPVDEPAISARQRAGHPAEHAVDHPVERHELRRHA